jgi:hypothetical protein
MQHILNLRLFNVVFFLQINDSSDVKCEIKSIIIVVLDRSSSVIFFSIKGLPLVSFTRNQVHMFSIRCHICGDEVSTTL